MSLFEEEISLRVELKKEKSIKNSHEHKLNT